MLSQTLGKKICICAEDYVLFDLETTGVDPKIDEVVEISAVKVRGGKITDEFSTLVNPGIPIPPDVSQINGITDDMVAQSPNFKEALEKFLQFAGDDILVGHNIHRFDLKFINRDARKFLNAVVGNDFIDTLDIANGYLPELERHNLAELAMHYDISTKGAHRALCDCRMNYEVYERLKEEMKNPSELAKRIPKCPKCGNVLVLRNGTYGEFWGCKSYPDCRYTRNIR